MPQKSISIPLDIIPDEQQNISFSSIATISTLKKVVNWLILIVALIGGATTGVFYYYVQPECQVLKSAWRMFGFTISIIPLAWLEYKKLKDSFLYTRENILNVRLWNIIMWASFWYLLWTVGFLISINHVSVAQANLLTNLSPIVIVIYHLVNGRKVAPLEMFGTVLATVGACFLAFDSEVHSSEGMVDVSEVSTSDRIFFGFVVGILGSIGAAFCLTKNQELKYSYPLCLGTLIMSFFVSLQACLISVIFEGATFSFSPKNGIFGMFSSEWFVLHIYIVIITGYGGYFCYILSVKYFDALLVAVVLTLEPVASALIVYSLGWQSFPGTLTIIGCFCIIPGIIAVVAGEDKTEDSKKPVSIPLIMLKGEDV